MFDQKKIKTLLDKINWLSNSFQENDYKNVSALEKSLLKEKVLMFFDEIQNIPTSLTKERTVTEIKNTVLEKQQQPAIKSEEIKEPIPEPEVKIVNVFEELEKKEVIVPVPKRIVPEAPEVSETPKNIVEEKIIEPVKDSTIPQTVFSKEEKFKQTEIFQKQIAKPKRDMREIIDLNKSFILKAELFSQNNDLYNQFLNEINQTRTEENAETVLGNWTRKLNWKTEENKAYDLIVKVIEKRFLPLI